MHDFNGKTKKNIILEVFKAIHGINTEYLNDIFEVKMLPYSLLDPCRLIQPRFNTTTFGLRSFAYCGSKLWNDLPNSLKKIENVTAFKIALRNWDGPSDLQVGHYL